jgi:acyl carrier protein
LSTEHATIRAFIESHLDGQSVSDSEDLFATGLVSSLFAVQIVVWIQNTFDVQIRSDDLDMKNFRSIDDIARFVARRHSLTRS